MIQPQFVNGKWRKPVISGHKKAELREFFYKAGVPWVYEAEKPEVHLNSTYNRKPKAHKYELNYEAKIATIRKNLSTQDERLEKIRMERLTNKPWVGYDKVLVGVMKGLSLGDGEGKKIGGKKTVQAARVAEQTELKEMGIEAGPRKLASKGGATSKGGSIRKKEREVLQLNKGNVSMDMSHAETSPIPANKNLTGGLKQKEMKESK